MQLPIRNRVVLTNKTPSGLVRAAMSLGAGRASIFREVVIPGALPNIVTGLSVGMGVSWICLISAEMISGQYGVGYFTWVAYGIVKYSSIVVGMLTILCPILSLLSCRLHAFIAGSHWWIKLDIRVSLWIPGETQ